MSIRKSHSTIAAYLALIVAVSGSAYAAATIKSSHIVDDTIKSRDVRDDTLKGGGLKGIDIIEDTLGTVPSADTLDGKDSGDFLGADDKAADSELLDGKNSDEFLASNGKAANSDQLDGHDVTAWNAGRVIDAHGPLPLTGTYTSKGGTLYISTAGSGFRSPATGPGRIGAEVFVDGNLVSRMQVFANERDSHKAFVPEFAVVEGLAAGEHTFEIKTMYNATWCNTSSEITSDYCTSTNGDDVFHVAVMEIPSS